VENYREIRLPKLGSDTRKKHSTHIENYILRVFEKAELDDVDDRKSIEEWPNREAWPHPHFEEISSAGDAR
jgi:hypothetical protein